MPDSLVGFLAVVAPSADADSDRSIVKDPAAVLLGIRSAWDDDESIKQHISTINNPFILRGRW